MKRQNPPQAKNARKPSDAILAERYLELQRLRDEVRKAEIEAPYSREPSGPPPLRLRNRPQQGPAIEKISQIGGEEMASRGSREL
jgi:hypothetical protein